MRSFSAVILVVEAKPRVASFPDGIILLENILCSEHEKHNYMSLARGLPRKHERASSLTTFMLTCKWWDPVPQFCSYRNISFDTSPSSTMAVPRNSLRAFLGQAKVNLQRAISKNEKVTLVIGNESAGCPVKSQDLYLR